MSLMDGSLPFYVSRCRRAMINLLTNAMGIALLLLGLFARVPRSASTCDKEGVVVIRKLREEALPRLSYY